MSAQDIPYQFPGIRSGACQEIPGSYTIDVQHTPSSHSGTGIRNCPSTPRGEKLQGRGG